jgi:Ulp1 protease family, C-terminal catalytic domain
MNCQNVHWVAIVIDFPALTIWHGDSLGWRLDLEHKKLLDWWFSEYSVNKFMYHDMPITRQSDSFSCGILAWNALSHFFLPEQHPLMHPSNVAAERLQVLLCVCNYQQEEGLTTSNTYYKYICTPSTLPSSGNSDDGSDFHIDTSSSDEGYNTADESSLPSRNSDLPDDGTSLCSNVNTASNHLPTPDLSIQLLDPKRKFSVESSICIAVKEKSGPLLSFFKPCTRAKYEADLAREQESPAFKAEQARLESISKKIAQDRIARKWELAQLRQKRR